MLGDLIDALDVPLKWALFDRVPMRSWSHGAVALLGDACHPMLPYGAQGAAQAIEDAAVLAASLSTAASVPDALGAYQARRRERTARVQAISHGNGRRFHLPDGPDQQARDAAMASSFGLSPEIDWLYGHEVEAGYRELPDRSTDMIISGAENIGSVEVGQARSRSSG